MVMKAPIIIGITGSVGSGKSVLAAFWGVKGWRLIDVDDLGREVVDSKPEIIKHLAREFGADIIDDEGRLKRRLLRARGFAGADGITALNNTVHPSLITLLKQRITEEKARLPEQPIIVDCALIFEWEVEGLFDAVITVWADEDIRLERFLTRDGMNPSVFYGIEKAQLTQPDKLRHSTFQLENNGDLQSFLLAAECLYKRVMQHFIGETAQREGFTA